MTLEEPSRTGSQFVCEHHLLDALVVATFDVRR